MIDLENRIDKIFKNLKSANKKAFISFTTAGFPEEDTSLEIIKSIADSGAHIHEISFPHAEAQADGPIIQLANIESIKNPNESDEHERETPHVLKSTAR